MTDDKKTWDGRPLDWRNKATDRFVLRWIKRYLSAPLSLALARVPGIRPWMVTVAASSLGTAAGAVFALGHGWQAGLLAAAGQILDGVDGQLARLTGRSSARGALLDSVLDRVADAALVLGSAAYLARNPLPYVFYVPAILALAFVAVVASNLVSYSGARAGELGLSFPAPPHAGEQGHAYGRDGGGRPHDAAVAPSAAGSAGVRRGACDRSGSPPARSNFAAQRTVT